ncbi:MAG: AIPR family protein [Jannaschia helgolandensis]
MLLREGTTPAKRRNLKEMIPPKRKLTKNDIAKYHEAWRCKPNQVAMAGEKNFAAFMAALDDDPTIVPSPLDARWYRAMTPPAAAQRWA